jgi:mRNA interferase MazF
VGREQDGPRFAVIVQSDDLPLSTTVVVPTSTSARPADFRPEIVIADRPTRALVEQMTAVDPQRLGDRVGRLTFDELRAIDRAIRDILEL